jgi:hypothetical protein
MKLKFVLALVPFSFSIPAAESKADKSQFSLFNPTPRASMREMSTDRPDQTESAYTVDAGHFQVETDLFAYSRDSDNGSESESFAALSLNLKVGLLNNVDLQIGINPYLHNRTRDTNLENFESESGFGDIVTRVKINLVGNDSGRVVFAVMPFLKLPLGDDGLSNGSLEGGAIFPLEFGLPAGWNLVLMTEFDVLRNESSAGYHVDFVNSATVSHDIIGPLAGYLEFFSVVSTQSDSPWQGFVDFGFTYALTKDLQLDAGVNIGVTRSAPDWGPFLGLSFRF